jgi:hypothetical protein
MLAIYLAMAILLRFYNYWENQADATQQLHMSYMPDTMAFGEKADDQRE